MGLIVARRSVAGTFCLWTKCFLGRFVGILGKRSLEQGGFAQRGLGYGGLLSMGSGRDRFATMRLHVSGSSVNGERGIGSHRFATVPLRWVSFNWGSGRGKEGSGTIATTPTWRCGHSTDREGQRGEREG